MYTQNLDWPFMMVAIIFCIIAIAILFQISKSIMEWVDNNRKPALSGEAKVVTKRTETWGFSQGRVSTHYHVTFELTSGNRWEFEISGKEYGIQVEGDTGTLTYQGTRYLGFVRHS